MKQLAIILLVCCVVTSSVQAIECLAAPDHSESGWWSWREIDGRKCWYKKVGAVPPKSEFTWPQGANKAPPAEAPGPQESSPMQASEAVTATLAQIEVARVKPVELTAPNFRLSEARVGLIEGFYLSGVRGIGGRWEIPADIKSLPDTFELRYGRW
jgi:hypothetical protein